jgi:hypothetical protein
MSAGIYTASNGRFFYTAQTAQNLSLFRGLTRRFGC